ncbi:hypothetical protein IQ235_01745 [Oscillatoriales cyanobacterium LEGE 11467]|uniref:Uncharacterized protein n=1 Tax=Zarconia navalis LEGE 11467 TaxID=1828826 RepID=A0A928Z7B9_9CYAN|nr:hypothetical protein [Zarconia navalis]MBE9039518.1 hypothetical protein [Zarconia navalis LEGE 11467]
MEQIQYKTASSETLVRAKKYPQFNCAAYLTTHIHNLAREANSRQHDRTQRGERGRQRKQREKDACGFGLLLATIATDVEQIVRSVHGYLSKP